MHINDIERKGINGAAVLAEALKEMSTDNRARLLNHAQTCSACANDYGDAKTRCPKLKELLTDVMSAVTCFAGSKYDVVCRCNTCFNNSMKEATDE